MSVLSVCHSYQSLSVCLLVILLNIFFILQMPARITS